MEDFESGRVMLEVLLDVQTDSIVGNINVLIEKESPVSKPSEKTPEILRVEDTFSAIITQFVLHRMNICLCAAV